MKSILKSLVVVLGLFCIIIGFRLLLNNYNNQIINNAPIYCDNRDYVMALFFPRWDAIQLKYDPTWEKVYIPRFHKFISDNPGFHLYKKSNIPKVLTKEYVRRYIENVQGIDYKRVEKWLLDIIRLIQAEVYSYEEVFATPPSEYNIWNSTYMKQLRQVLTFIPVRERLGILLEKIPVFFIPIVFLIGLPMLIVQVFFWIKSLITRKQLNVVLLRKNQAILFLFIAVIIAGIYSASLLISELRNPPLYTNQLQLKLEVFRKSFVMLGVSFLFTFLSLWSLKVVFSLLIEKIRELVYLLKRTRIVKLP